MALLCRDISVNSQCAALLFTRGCNATSSRCQAISNATSCLSNALCAWEPSARTCSITQGALFAAGLAGAIGTAALDITSTSTAAAIGSTAPITDSSSTAGALLPQRAVSETYNAPASFTLQYLQQWQACSSRAGRAACESSPHVAVLPMDEQLLGLKAADLGLLLPGTPQGPSISTFLTLFMTVVPLLGVGVGILALVMYVAWHLRCWDAVRQAGNRQPSRREGS